MENHDENVPSDRHHDDQNGTHSGNFSSLSDDQSPTHMQQSAETSARLEQQSLLRRASLLASDRLVASVGGPVQPDPLTGERNLGVVEDRDIPQQGLHEPFAQQSVLPMPNIPAQLDPLTGEGSLGLVEGRDVPRQRLHEPFTAQSVLPMAHIPERASQDQQHPAFESYSQEVGQSLAPAITSLEPTEQSSTVSASAASLLLRQAQQEQRLLARLNAENPGNRMVSLSHLSANQEESSLANQEPPLPAAPSNPSRSFGVSAKLPENLPDGEGAQEETSSPEDADLASQQSDTNDRKRRATTPPAAVAASSHSTASDRDPKSHAAERASPPQIRRLTVPLSSDGAKFSAFDCLLRQQLEFVEIDSPSQSPIFGIKCRHCDSHPPSYPMTLSQIYPRAQSIARLHYLSEQNPCRGIPQASRQQLIFLHNNIAEDVKSLENFQESWAQAASSQGIREAVDGGGLHMVPPALGPGNTGKKMRSAGEP